MTFGAKIYKIKKDKVDEWRAWCTKLGTELRELALSTIKEEGNTLEGFVLFQIGDDFFTLGFGEGDFLPANIDKEINRLHIEKKKECLDENIAVELLYFLKTGE